MSAARIAVRRRSISVWESSPFDHRARPSETSAEHDHENVVARFYSSAAVRFIERDRYCRSGSVSITIEIYKHLLPRNAEPIRDCFDDPDVCLVRNDAGDVLDGQSSLVEGFLGRLQHCAHRLFINLFADHVDRVQVKVDIFARDRTARAAAGHEQNIGILAVTANVRANHAMSAPTMTQDSGSSAVPEKHASVPVGPIRD